MTELAPGQPPDEDGDDVGAYLRLVSLRADGSKILINDDPRMSMPMPPGIYRLDNRQKKILVKDLIFTGCDRFNVDYISEDTVTKCANEVVSRMYEMSLALKKARQQAAVAKDAKAILAERAEMDENIKIITYITNEIMNSTTLKAVFDTGQILHYNNNDNGYDNNNIKNIYCPLGEQIVRMAAERIGDFVITNHMKKEILEHIRDKTAVPRSRFNSEVDIINIKNGLLNIFTLEFKPHTPEHLSTIQYPVEYDRTADCPETKKFLGEVIQDPHKLKEFLKFWAYLLLKDCRYEKAALFVGGGANGKGTLIKLMEAHEGPENCSHVSLHDLGDDRFAAAGLWGKTLNSYADLKSDKIKSTGNLKTIISGDSIEAQHKNKPRFRFRNFAKIVYSANNPPETDDQTYAFYRRWLIIAFDRTFVNTTDDSLDGGTDTDTCASDPDPEVNCEL